MVDQQQQPYQSYPIVDQATGQPYNQVTGSSLIESQESRLIEWILNPENILRQLENTLRGVRTETQIDKVTGRPTEAIIVDVNPMMSEEGIRSVMRTMRGYVQNPVFSTSNIAEENIIVMTLQFLETFLKQTVLNSERWKLSYEDFEMLNNLIDDIIYATLLRSKNGHLIEYITQSYSERYIGGNMGGGGGMAGMPRKRGWFGKMFGAYA